MACQNVAIISLQHCLDQLCDNSASLFYVKQRGKLWLSSKKKRQLKLKLVNSLFDKSKISIHKDNSKIWKSLSMFLPDVLLASSSLQFSLVLQQKKPDEARYLDLLIQNLLSDKKDLYNSVITVLICLSEEGNKSRHTILNQTFKNTSTSNLDRNFLLKDKTMPALLSNVNQPKDLMENLENRFKVKNPSQSIGLNNKKRYSKFSLNKNFSNRLVSHSVAVKPFAENILKFDDNILNYHKLLISEARSNSKITCNQSSFSFLFYNDDEPYVGYKMPLYDLKVWESKHPVKENLTWEATSTFTNRKKLLYVTEAGSKVYDFLWQLRNQLSAKLINVLAMQQDQAANNLCNDNFETDEKVLLYHALLVSVGIPSETFHFNKIANMFIPKKNLFFTGLTFSSTRALLLKFAEWGTAYWRLLQFSSLKKPSHYYVNNVSDQNEKGVIFQAFCESVLDFLHIYYKNVLLHSVGCDSLLQRSDKFRLTGAQISYMCRFCQCGDPSKACSTLKWEYFPTDIKLISYIYEEAVFCTSSSEYMVLLYFLKKCCIPYLEFIKNWMFFGICWELTSDFFLQINSNNVGRRDRLRWTGYVNPVESEIKLCVPSFLQPVSQSLFVCGKTIELLKLINPEHFLCTHLFTVPSLSFEFSKSQMQNLSDQWYQFHFDLREIEVNRSLSWLDFVESEKKHDVESPESMLHLSEENLIAEKIAEEKSSCEDALSFGNLPEMQESQENFKPDSLDDNLAEKSISESLKLEKIGDAQDSINEDTFYEKKLDALRDEAKNEILAHYEALYKEADSRIVKANWKKKRHMLGAKRRDFFESDKFSGISETGTKILSSESSIKIHQNIDHSTTSFRENVMSRNITTGRKQVPGCNISQSSVFSSVDVEESKKSQNLNLPGLPVQSVQSGFVFDQEKSSAPSDIKTQRKQVLGFDVSHSTVFSNDNSDESIKRNNLNCLMPKDQLNFVDTIFDSNTLENCRSQRKQVSSCNILQSTVFSETEVDKSITNENWHSPKLSEEFSPNNMQHKTNNPRDIKTQRKQIPGCNISQSVVFSNQEINKTIKKEKLSTSELSKQCEFIECKHKNNMSLEVKTQRKHIPGYHVTQSTVFSEIETDETARRNPNVIENASAGNRSCSSMQHEALSTVGRIEIKNNCLMQLNQKKSHSSDSTIQNLMYPISALHQVKNGDCFEMDNQTLSHSGDANELSNGVYLRLRCKSNSSGDLPDYFVKLPQVGTYTHHIASTLEKFSPESTKYTKELSRSIDLLSFYSKTSTAQDVSCSIEDDDDMASIDLQALPVLLQNCIISPIKRYSAFVNRCAVNYFMMDLKLPSHFMAMRRFLLLEDGEFSSSLSKNFFDLMHSGSSPSEALKPLILDSILSHALQSSTNLSISALNLSIKVKYLPLAFSAVDIKIFDCLQLYYHVDWPINVIVTESCHNKYNQVFSFLLKLKLVSWTLHDVRTRLNHIGADRSTAATALQIRKLQLFRHEMHNFVKVMQGYVSTQVLHVCWLEFYNNLLENINELEDLHLRHAEYLNKCVMRCLLTKKAQNVMNVICDILASILRFDAQLSATFSFSLLHKTYREFARLSNFLYRVVSKLVQRGYQPHLEDFLTRLNFNGYYKL